MASDPDHDFFSDASAIGSSGPARTAQAPALSPDELIELLAKDKRIVTPFKPLYADYQVVTEIKSYSRFCDYISRVLYKGIEIDSDYLIAHNIIDNSALDNLLRKKSRYDYKDTQNFDTLSNEERTALLKMVVDLHIRKCGFVSKFLLNTEKTASKHIASKRIVIAIVLLIVLIGLGGVYLYFFYKPDAPTPTGSVTTPTIPIPTPAPPKPAPSVPDTSARPSPAPALPNDLKCKLYPNEEDCKKQ